MNGGPGSADIIANNNLTGGDSGYILFYDLPSTDNVIFTGNVVNSDQSIGVLLFGSDTSSGIKCSGNTPAATICNSRNCSPC